MNLLFRFVFLKTCKWYIGLQYILFGVKKIKHKLTNYEFPFPGICFCIYQITVL